MPPALRKEKILIIEANASFGDKIASVLRSRGYESVSASTADDGMNSLYSNIPHLVILDADLPGNMSYAILAKKQSEQLLAKIPVFLISTDVSPIDMSLVPQGSVTEFLVTLNMNAADIADKVDRQFGYEANQPVAEPKEDDSNKKKVLWVEDDRLIGTILSKKLISSGFELVHAKNGDEALEAMNETVPDAIVLDLVLPNMSGFDILKAARDNPKLARVPVMILSNLSKQSDIERAKALGAQKFLVKAAASLDQIVQEIRSMCG